MRAPARLFGISLTVFVVLTLILSHLESDTVTRTINKFPSIRQQWQARAAAMQSHFSATSSDAAACDIDAKTCSEPYTSHDSSSSSSKQLSDQTISSEWDSEEAMENSRLSKDRHPSTKDADRDKDRGFTDAEQAAALERLEFKYGSEAKVDTSILWMATSTTTDWNADPTAALDSEAEKARKMLGEEYGDLATTTSTAEEEEETEKGWRTTGFETKVKSTQKSLIDGGGGNGTATVTGLAKETGELMEEVVGTVTTATEVTIETTTAGVRAKTGKLADKTKNAGALITQTKKGAKPTEKPTATDEDDETAELDDAPTTTKKLTKPTRKPTKNEDEDEELNAREKASAPKGKSSKATSKNKSDRFKKSSKSSHKSSAWSSKDKSSYGDEDVVPPSRTGSKWSSKDAPDDIEEETNMFKNSKRPHKVDSDEGGVDASTATTKNQKLIAPAAVPNEIKALRRRRWGD